MLCLVLAFGVLPSVAANSPEVDRALTWLGQQPQANGTLAGEGGSVATPLQARAETLVTLKQLSTAPSVLADVVAQEPATPTEYAARQAIALAPLGRDVSASIAAVLAAQNADGGFAGAPGYQSDALDTAYALLALKAAASANSSAISKALGYLQGAQGVDGSFGVNEQPSVFVTAHALQALNAFAQTFTLTANIQPAKAYLTGAQSSGAYAAVLDNAAAALALSGATLDTSAFGGAQAALKSAQAADGSWSDDPYLTALAIRALVATASAPPPATTGQVSGSVVDQSSGAPLAGVQVQLTGAQSASATTDSSGSFTLTGLAPGSYSVQISLAGYTPLTLSGVPVTAGVVASLGTVRLSVATTTASLQGTVRDGTTGQPIAGATVAVSGGPSATTDATGAYQLAGLIPGSVTLTVTATGYQSVSVGATLSAGFVVSFSPGLYAPGQGPTDATLKGKVVDRATGQPISGATVAVGALAATTNTTGDFSIASIPAGSVSINVSAAGYVSATFTATLAVGVNDAGALAIGRQAASVTITGRVTDSAGGAAIGGATLQVVGTTLTATSDSTGRYTIVGVTSAQFILAVSAPGYQSRQVAATLPGLTDSTVDVVLDRVPPSSINIVGIAQDATSYDPFTKFDLDVSVQNTAAASANVVLVATVNNALGNPVIQTFPVFAAIPGNTTRTVELEPHLANQVAGTYGIVVHAFDADNGTLLAEGTASFGINAVQRMSGGITLDPPITQSGTSQPVHMTANLANLGNLPIPAGPVSLTVTLIAPDSTSVPKAHITAGAPAVTGTPLNGPVGAGMDAQGNYYTVNRNDLRVLKVAPDGQVTVVTTLPSFLPNPSVFVGPVDLTLDTAGNIYVLNNSFEIFRIAPDGTFTRIRTNQTGQISFARDAAGTFYVVYSNGTYKVARIDASGAQTIWEAEGFSNPQGIVHGADGNIYVSDRNRSAILKVTPQGAVSVFASVGGQSNGLAQDAGGNFYVSIGNLNIVLKVTPQGATSTYATGLNGPSEVQFDAQGNLYVINQGDGTIARVPPGGGAAQLFARSLVPSPQGMAYDASGNLYVAGSGGQLARLDPSDNASIVSTTLGSARGVAANAAGDVFVASIGNGTITRTSGTTTTTFAAGLSSPYGLAFDAAGTLYATENAIGANRIDAFDASGVKTVAAQAMLTTPQDVYAAPNGDRYVLNQDSITTTPAGGGPVRVLVQGGFTGVTFAPAGDGGFYVQESTSIKRVSPAGVVTSVKTGLPFLSNGIVADASGNLIVVDQSNRAILRIDTAGNVTTITTFPQETPVAIAGDQAGGVYTGTNFGNLMHVTSAGVVTRINPSAGSVGGSTRIALDAVGNRVYVLGSSTVRTVDLATGAVTTVANVQSLNALSLTAGGLLLTNSSTRELISMTPQGQSTAVLAGFTTPTALTTDGTQLYFWDSNNNRVLVFTPGGYPRVVVFQTGIRYLAWHAGTLYATTSGGFILAFTPGVDTAFRNYITQGVSLQGLAFRADGALTTALDGENRVLTYDASQQIIASYAGISNPAGLAVDGGGNVFVGNVTNQQVVRILPSGKQSSVFASGISVAGLTFDAAGTLYASSSSPLRVVSFSSTGAQTVVASSTASGFPHGLAVASDGVYMIDQFFEAVRKVVGTDLPIFSAGVSSPGATLADPAGNGVLIASNGNGAVVRVVNGGLTPVTSGLTNAIALAYASNGDLLVGASTGTLWAVDATGASTQLTNLTNVFSANPQLSFMTVDPSGLVYALDTLAGVNRIERLTYTPATPPPPAGTVVLPPRSVTFGGLGTDSLPVPVDFGTWLPPYGGDFLLTVTAGSTSGQATNVLHVGPNATGQIVPAKATVPPGSSALALTVSVDGADFTTLAKVDPANLTASGVTQVSPTAMGADASGNLLITTSSDGKLRRMSQAGVTTTLFTLPAGQTIGMRGMVPVDDQGNAYISGGTSNHDVLRVAPDGTATTLATLAESVVSLARASTNVLYALGTAHISRIATNGTVTTLPVAPFSSSYALTVDGNDDLYAQFFGNVINMYGDGGSITNIVRPDATGLPTFEYEGVNVSGDCADNVFVTPNRWDALGQAAGEEHTLIQYVGKTGMVAQILDGLTLNPQLADLDFIAYDRFSESLLMWTDVDGRIHHIPVTCGAISTDVHLVFPAGQPAGGFDVTPKQVIQNADGSTEYVWSLKDVTHLGKSVHLTTTLSNVKLGDVIPVASSAFLVFQNTFVAGSVTVPLAIPTVGVDGQVDIAVGTDQPQYDANTDVVSTVTLTNRDAANTKSGMLTVQVSDPQGVVLATIAQAPQTIAPSASVAVSPPFNTGTFLTGSYLIKATLTDATTGATIATGSTGFDIVAGGAVVISSVTTDKQIYGAVDTATIMSRVRNVSDNAIASNLTTFVSVKDPSGQSLLNGSGAVPILVPQALKDSAFTLKLSSAPAGTYTVTETLVDSSQATIETRTTEFAVLSTADTGSGVRGALTSSKLANSGDPVTITATVANQGNAALTGLPVTIRIVNPTTSQLVQQPWVTTINVPQGGSVQVPQIWTTTGVAPGAYIAAASVTFGGREIPLGQDTITIGAIQPFTFPSRTNVPVSTVVESDPVTVAGIVAPAPISVTIGEYRIGNGGWTGASGFVNPGDVVSVRVASSDTFGTTTTAVLTISGFSAPFSVTTVNPDTTPDPFAFAPVINAPFATLITSNTVTITGIDTAVPVSIAGGEYSVNGGPWTSAAGTVGNGDTVAVRLTSAATLGTTTTAILTVSSFQAPFSVTTTALDASPDPFTFAPQNNVPVSTVRVSNPVTIAGINTPVPISVTGGEYSINGGPFTSVPGNVVAGNTVVVHHTSSASYSTTVTTKLTVSDVIATFSSTTEGQDNTPDPIAFTAQTNVPIASLRVSNSATITGINNSVPVSIAGGEYSLNGGAYTAAAGTVKAGDTVTVRETSASTFATTTTATLTVGPVTAPFAVTTKTSADVKTTPVLAGDERLLVLVSCNKNEEGDDWHKDMVLEAPKNGQPNGDDEDDHNCVTARGPFLDSYLTGLGIIHRIVTTTTDFKAEMRSGRYDAYWISGGADKLMDDLAEEVREATFRGDTLILDGVHDQRNGDLDEVVGVDYRGKPSGVKTVTLTGSMLPAGTFAASGTSPIRVRLTTGVRQAKFNTGDPAIATNAYGYGNGLLFAFDLTGTLMAQPSSTLLHDMLDSALAFVTPAVPATVSGGAYVPLTVTLQNSEPVAVNLDVTATLPAGFTLAAGAPPAIVTGSTVTWHAALPANGKQSLEWSVRAPTASGTYSIALALTQIYGSTSVPDGTATIPVVVKGLDAGLPALIAQLQALSLSSGSDRSARDGTVAKLQSARTDINTARWEDAIDDLVDAIGKLDSIRAVDTKPYQASIDNAIREVEERWWAALPACPASAPCRTP